MTVACTTLQAQSKRTISILGDSYSTFRGYVLPDSNYVWYPQKAENNDVQDIRQLWWHQLIRNNGFRLCQNNSFSGATICNTGYNGEDYSDRSYCTRLRFLGSPDIILVFGGTNDTWAKSPLGDFKYADEHATYVIITGQITTQDYVKTEDGINAEDHATPIIP